jgi:3-hydroxyacyl-CoA dehydrogenase
MNPTIVLTSRSFVAIVGIDNPPVNALCHPLREQLLAAIQALDADPGVRAIVIHGRGRLFAGGADIREFDAPPRAPFLNDVLLRIEFANKPVIAALHGIVLGGGAELALACHYRCASQNLALGFPEIQLGLLPGSGGIVRLPRLIGVERSLDMMLDGRRIDVTTALSLGIIDRVAAGDLLETAVEFATDLANEAAPIRCIRDLPRPSATSSSSFRNYENKLSGALQRVPAARMTIEAMKACCSLPFSEALARSRTLFEECRQSPESQALRHLFMAERGTKPTATALPVARIGVVGAGTMGRGIAVCAVLAGYEVMWVDSSRETLEVGIREISRIVEERSRKGRLGNNDPAVILRRVVPVNELEALAEADLVIEAVIEDIATKQEVFAQLGQKCRSGAILATNTSTLDVDMIAAASGRPGDVVGMHFFSPAHVMRLVEVIKGRQTTERSVATALAVSKRLEKVGIVVGNCFGFVGNRMLYAYGREKELLMLEGAEPAQIDHALESFGMAMGPNAAGDLAGLDVGYRARRAWKDRPRDPAHYRVSDLLVENGRLGQKNGKGFYLYEGGNRRGIPDPEVSRLVRAEAHRLGIVQREVDDDEIIERSVTALINEGGRLLDEGIARSADDIDAIWCGGYGFPRFRGGPMFHARTLGFDKVRGSILKLASKFGPDRWTPALWLASSVEFVADR